MCQYTRLVYGALSRTADQDYGSIPTIARSPAASDQSRRAHWIVFRRATRMHEEYVHHKIVQKDNTTITTENIYARRDWVHKGFPDYESTVRGWYIQRPRADPQSQDNVNLQLVL